MLGYGTALKMLLLPPELLPNSLSRDEVAALFNTLHKFSSAIAHVKELTELRYAQYYAADRPAAAAAAAAAAATAASAAASGSSSSSPSLQQRTMPRAPAAATPPTDAPGVTTTPAATPAAAAATAASTAASAAPAAAPAVAAAAERATLESAYGGAGYVSLLDTALAALARAVSAGALTSVEEGAAVALALRSDSRLLLAARHFGTHPSFATHVRSALLADYLAPRATSAAAAAPGAAGTGAVPGAGAGAASASSLRAGSVAAELPDAVVIGTGVAGMTAALRLLDRGARVVVLDKERQLGGNSAKASSGINGCCPPHSRSERNANDTVEAFAADTARSAKREPTGLIEVLAQRSSDAIGWLLRRTSIDLSKVAQLGGHSQVMMTD